MKNLFIKNGTVVTLGEQNRIIENGAVLIQGSLIKKIGKTSEFRDVPADAEVIDASGRLIMPGFINMHMHFYSTFARGMMPKQPPAKNFMEILERLWWPLDKALNEKDIYYSTMIPLINGIRAGTTTFFDHHESQGYQEGALDIIEKAMRETGLRGCLCLGISDRYSKGSEGIDENTRFIKKIQAANSKNREELITGMFGLHAAFTVEDESLTRAAAEAAELNVGFHVHAAEDIGDQKINMAKHKSSVVKRLYKAGCLGKKSLAVHCVHLSDEELGLLSETNTPVIHNPQSNMNNAVGVADIPKMLKTNILCGLGTDGMSPGMQDDVRTANILHKLNKKDPRVFFCESCQMLLSGNAEIANRFFTDKIGIIKEGACADIILIDYVPPTPLNESTFFGHFLFGICGAPVDTTIVNGEPLMKNRKILCADEEAVFAASRKQAKDFWKRF